MKPIFIVLIVVAALIFLYFIAAYIGYRLAFYNNVKKTDRTFAVLEGPGYDDLVEDEINLIKKAMSIPFEQVYVKTFDGKQLAARLYIYDEKAPVLIQFHGYKGIGIRDMAGGLQSALKNRCNALVVDQRGSGLSDGKTLSFGIKERKDVISWINYVKNRFGSDTKIGLLGISMGASTCLMCLDQNLPINVKMILVDCPFSSPKEIVKKVSKQMGVPWFLASIILYSGAFFFGHFRLNETTAIKTVKEAKIPIGIIHGKEDTFVPYYMSEEIVKSNPSIQLVGIDNADHGMSYFRNNEKWESFFKDYVEKFLTNC